MFTHKVFYITKTATPQQSCEEFFWLNVATPTYINIQLSNHYAAMSIELDELQVGNKCKYGASDDNKYDKKKKNEVHKIRFTVKNL